MHSKQLGLFYSIFKPIKILRSKPVLHHLHLRNLSTILPLGLPLSTVSPPCIVFSLLPITHTLSSFSFPHTSLSYSIYPFLLLGKEGENYSRNPSLLLSCLHFLPKSPSVHSLPHTSSFHSTTPPSVHAHTRGNVSGTKRTEDPFPPNRFFYLQKKTQTAASKLKEGAGDFGNGIGKFERNESTTVLDEKELKAGFVKAEKKKKALRGGFRNFSHSHRRSTKEKNSKLERHCLWKNRNQLRLQLKTLIHQALVKLYLLNLLLLLLLLFLLKARRNHLKVMLTCKIPEFSRYVLLLEIFAPILLRYSELLTFKTARHLMKFVNS